MRIAGAAAEVRAVLHDDEATHVTESSPDFWLLAAALRAFVDEEGRGSLPLEVPPRPAPPHTHRS